MTETKTTHGAMEAGRELDALVAEKVLGWTDVGMKKMYTIVGGDITANELAWAEVDGEESRGIAPGSPQYEWGRGEFPVPRFSTDIAAAWQVVQELRKRDICVDIEVRENVSVWAPPPDGPMSIDWTSVADTAPHAICLAALRAVPALPEEDDHGT
jgi:ABA sandwich protein